MAVAYWLQQLCGCNVSALSLGEKPSEHSESWRLQVYFAGGLRGDGSPESEPRRRVSQGFYGLPLPGPCLAGRTGVRSGEGVGAETSSQKQMCGGGWLGAVGWTLLSHRGRDLSFLPSYWDSFSYSLSLS